MGAGAPSGSRSLGGPVGPGDRGAQAAGQWVPSPLLQKPGDTPRFLRAAWDQKASQAFGPWRVGGPVDPAVPVHELPALAGRAGAVAAGAAASTPLSLEATPRPDRKQDPQVIDSVPPPATEEDHAASRAALAAAQAQGHAKGLEEGRAKALAEVEAERARESELIRHLAIELRALSEDPDRFFEPLRRLALHIAEQLVRGELLAAPQAITQIVRQALAALDPAPGDPVVVSLHPDDLAMLQAASPSFLDQEGLKLQADSQLHRGSVRLRLDDTVLEDLVEHRLQALVERLLVHPGGRSEGAMGSRDSVLLREFASPSMPGAAEPLAAGLRRRPVGLGEVIDASSRPMSDGPSPAGPGEEFPA